MDRGESSSGPNKRRLLPLAPAAAGGSGQGAGGGTTTKGRRQVTAACEACRRRKSKCNAERPKCSLCVRHDTECKYATAPTETHSQALKRKHSELQDRITPYEELFDILKSKSETESLEILKRIRSGNDVGSILRQAKDGDLLMQLSLAPEARRRYEFPYIPDMPATIMVPDNLYLRSFIYETTFHAHPTHGSALDVNREGHGDDRYLKPYHAAQLVEPSFSNIKVSEWTPVLKDDHVLRKLLQAYLYYQHSWTAAFHMDYFLQDMAAGRTRFCSTLLVNAVLAAACAMSRELPDRNKFWVPQTLGYQFLAEAKRLWEIESGSVPGKLTTIQAAIILSIVATTTAMDKVGTSYLLQAMAMATNINLFTATCGTRDGITRKARAFTAWGLFCWQAWQRFYFGLPPLLASAPAYPLPDPMVDPKWFGEVWIRYPLGQDIYPTHLGCTMKANFELRKLMNEMASQIFEDNGSPHITVEKALECKSMLDNWFSNLPEPLIPTKVVLPDHIKIHIEYYGTMITLVRLLAQCGTPLDLTWQNVITHAEVRLETLLRLYYLRHSFESYDPLLMHWLMFLGDSILLKLDSPQAILQIPSYHPRPNPESLRSTLILCAKGLYDQSRNFHIAVLLYRLLRDRMKANDLDLLRTHIFASPSSSSSSGVIAEDDEPLMTQYVQAQWLAPIVTPIDGGSSDDSSKRTLDYLLREYEKLSIDRRGDAEDVSEAETDTTPPLITPSSSSSVAAQRITPPQPPRRT
ncbi:uncharacterized protein GGS22DRAFT_186400 [Annulohypoxylon maeteangense]|uniref:uncharacterized protein n=1 Tax=Annulohypoxylon maeteangense TaxID=1927788 RepID=UPI0020077094|nr:uncharacterized protein GGS22DRAFT_186400 [Annulohypoxylon maeteangense]KAI0887566.1 hypothetical protein GGS22DRAFT_186400 [Annulohypoxylon maeteangense]